VIFVDAKVILQLSGRTSLRAAAVKGREAVDAVLLGRFMLLCGRIKDDFCVKFSNGMMLLDYSALFC
jgi:hypothetical protein